MSARPERWRVINDRPYNRLQALEACTDAQRQGRRVRLVPLATVGTYNVEELIP